MDNLKTQTAPGSKADELAIQTGDPSTGSGLVQRQDIAPTTRPVGDILRETVGFDFTGDFLAYAVARFFMETDPHKFRLYLDDFNDAQRLRS